MRDSGDGEVSGMLLMRVRLSFSDGYCTVLIPSSGEEEEEEEV